jgi:hypothetical protein
MSPPKGPHRLWIETLGEGDHLICPDRDTSEEVHFTFDIVLEVAVGYWTRERHSFPGALVAQTLILMPN